MSAEITQEMIDKVNNYMRIYVKGFANAMPHKIISATLEMENRVFRIVCSHIPNVVGSCRYGYYYFEDNTTNPLEIEVFARVVEIEQRSRLRENYRRHKAQKNLLCKVRTAFQGQREIIFI